MLVIIAINSQIIIIDHVYHVLILHFYELIHLPYLNNLSNVEVFLLAITQSTVMLYYSFLILMMLLAITIVNVHYHFKVH